jgi:NAD(P)-dependent dehydrogenase (short-subunit alcohol dehydrogenase family)
LKFNPFSLEGKNILITGASSGIGKVCAIECAKAGSNLILLGRDLERLKATYDEVEQISNKSGQIHHLFSIDLDFEQNRINSVIEEAVEKIGKLSGFIHAAGIEKTLPVSAMKSVDYGDLFRVNVFSGFELVKIISKKKNSSDNASFVFISSITAVIGRSGLSGYSATKGAIVASVRSMAIELSAKNIRINCVSPGTVLTPMMINYLNSIPVEDQEKRKEGFPLGLGQPEDVAYACIYLLSEASKWVTGQNLVVDGGYTAR